LKRLKGLSFEIFHEQEILIDEIRLPYFQGGTKINPTILTDKLSRVNLLG
jgi:hypothetical protein